MKSLAVTKSPRFLISPPKWQTREPSAIFFSVNEFSLQAIVETGKTKPLWLIFLSSHKKASMKQNLSNLTFHKSSSEKYEKGCEKLTSGRSCSMSSLFTPLISSFCVIPCCPRMYISTCFETALRAAEWAQDWGRYSSDISTRPLCALPAVSHPSATVKQGPTVPGGSSTSSQRTSVLSHSMAVHQENKSVLFGRREISSQSAWLL